MESSAIISECAKFSIPVITLRVVLDTAIQDLPLDFNRLCDREMKLSMPRLLGAIACKPSLIFSLLRFQRQSARAAERLATVLAAVLSV